MPPTLSKTINIEPVSEIELLKQTFDPIARGFCLQLQSQGMVGRKLKVGVKDGEWQGTELDFTVWQYDKLIEQIGGNLAVTIDWSTVDAIHLSVSDIVPKEDMPNIGNPDLVA
ncbi:hypothetical protein [Amphritea sp. HPY]|uniref:hypothetical protein n=1 Tax=Amphritea sp. HPY TaxID=3421652 RepID=UPI003D7E3AC9